MLPAAPDRRLCERRVAHDQGAERKRFCYAVTMVQRQVSGAVATAAVDSGKALEAKAKRLIDEVVRPLIQVDGGQIELVSVTEARMVVRLGGSYRGCPGRPYALHIVENAARRCLLPDIQVSTDDD